MVAAISPRMISVKFSGSAPQLNSTNSRSIGPRQVVLRSSGTTHTRHATDRRSSEVHGHRYAVIFSHVSDLVGFQNSTGRGEIRMDLAHCVPLAEHLERLL